MARRKEEERLRKIKEAQELVEVRKRIDLDIKQNIRKQTIYL